MMFSVTKALRQSLVIGVAFFMPLALFAENIKSYEVQFGTGSSLQIPQDWKVRELRRTEPQHEAFSFFLRDSSMVLLAADSNDPERRVSVTVFQSLFSSAGPGPHDGNRGHNTEIERIIGLAASQGYSMYSATSKTKGPGFFAEMAGYNSSGDYRVFTQITYGDFLPIVRIVMNRGQKDRLGEDEVALIANSAKINESLAENKNVKAGNATPTPAPTPKAVPPPSADAGKIVATYSDALIIVQGQDAVGSGFICRMDGHSYLFTNAHVVCACPTGFKLTNIKGAAYTVGASGMAVEHDIVRMEVQNPPQAFDLLENLQAEAKIGDEVVVSGNMNGGMVVRPVEGKILGIGPNLIEVDAPFEPGNSGSPIIHKASGKVIGIATYLLKHKVEEDGKTVTEDVRRFGYRIDSVKTWEPINWQLLANQATTLNRIELVSNDFVRLFNATDQQRFDGARYKSPIIQRAIYSYTNRLKGKSRQNVGEWRMAGEQLLGDLRSASKNDIVSFDMRNSYDYPRRQMQEQITFRDEVYKGISRVIDERN